jgi:mannose-1-phosphate guanylyltransferase
MMSDPMNLAHPDLWGLVLAGGEGKRLEAYVRQLPGASLPKQYMTFVGTRSMLEHTFDRAERVISRKRLLTIVSEHHLDWSDVGRQLASRAPDTVIVQPENKDTGVGLLLPLTYLHKRCPDAMVAVFPSDHFILEEERFLDYVRLAARAVQHDPRRIVLLAMEPQSAETEYGYIVPTDNNGHIDLCGCRHAAHFVEKPDLATARLLLATGALWNTMIMVFRVDSLLSQVAALYPGVASRFRALSRAIGTSAEKDKIDEIYRTLRPLNFSKDIVEKIAARGSGTISVLPVLQVTWSDWGSPQRLLAAKRSLELRRHALAPAIAPRPAARPRPSRPMGPQAELASR